MGIFSRISDIFKSNVNDALDKAEDPEKMIKLMVVEMQEALVKATSGLAQAMGSEKRLEKQFKNYQSKAVEWEGKAKAALTAGNDSLAKQALVKKQQMDSQATQYEGMWQQANATTTKLREQVNKLKSKLDEAKMKESMLIARSQNAKAQKSLAGKIGGLDDNSFAKFDKFEEKILKMESEAEALSELADEGSSLEDQFKELEAGSAVEDELAKLKAELQGGN